MAVLASEYVAALHPLEPAEVDRRLEALGFAAVESTVLGEELVAAAYEQVHSSAGDTFPRLRSTCPVVVSWVERFYPQLTHALVAGRAALHRPGSARARDLSRGHRHRLRLAVLGTQGRGARPAVRRRRRCRHRLRRTAHASRRASRESGRRAGRRGPQHPPTPAGQGALAHRRIPAPNPSRARHDRRRHGHGSRPRRRRPDAPGDRERRDRSPRRRHAQLRGLHRRPGDGPDDVRVREAQPHRRRARAPAATPRRQPHLPLGAASDRAEALLLGQAGGHSRARRRGDRLDAGGGRVHEPCRDHRLRGVRLRHLRRARGRDLPGRCDVGAVLPAAAQEDAAGARRAHRGRTARPAHGPREPALVRHAAQRRGLARHTLRYGALARDGRPRRVQGDQRQVRPHRRGRRSRPNRPAAERRHARERRVDTLRRRRVRDHPSRHGQDRRMARRREAAWRALSMCKSTSAVER